MRPGRIVHWTRLPGAAAAVIAVALLAPPIPLWGPTVSFNLLPADRIRAGGTSDHGVDGPAPRDAAPGDNR